MSESQTDPAGSHRSVLDDAIDRAVRRMVQIDGPPGLRRRVEARITGATPRSSAPWLRYVAAAAAIVLLVLVLGPRRDRPVVPQSADRTAESEPTPQTPPSRASEPVSPTAALDAAVPGVQPGRKPARKPHVDVIPMPKIHNVFGDPANTVAAANVPGAEGVGSPRGTETTPAAETMAIEGLSVTSLTPQASGGSTATGQTASHPAAGPKPQQGPGPDVRRRNVSVEVAIGDQTGAAAPIKKVVTLIVADRQKGSVRSSGNAVRPKDEPASMPLEHETLNVDATPTVQADDSVLLALALEYMPGSAEPEKGGRAQLNQHMSVTLESGKPMVIYRSADPASDRRITVEITATVMK
jgi:hypothetical protein